MMVCAGLRVILKIGSTELSIEALYRGGGLEAIVSLAQTDKGENLQNFQRLCLLLGELLAIGTTGIKFSI